VAKLEPHLVQPTIDNADVDLFLSDVEEENHNVHSVAAESDGDIDHQHDGLAHFIEFLNRRKKKQSRSSHSVALERYETQKLACQTEAEKELGSREVQQIRLNFIQFTRCEK
jgi:hypothetical protein